LPAFESLWGSFMTRAEIDKNDRKDQSGCEG
jgi:hypothetical protein